MEKVGVIDNPYIFQSKMSELMATLEFVRIYLDDLLYMTKRTLEDHLGKQWLFLSRLQDANLNLNAFKSTLCYRNRILWIHPH